jgi:hypothetical protein
VEVRWPFRRVLFDPDQFSLTLPDHDLPGIRRYIKGASENQGTYRRRLEWDCYEPPHRLFPPCYARGKCTAAAKSFAGFFC